MNANISQSELTVLTYLHEHAKGYGRGFQISPEELVEALNIEFSQLVKDASYLESHGLIGVETIQSDEAYIPIGFFLQGLGEDYMRELELQINAQGQAPSGVRRITVKVLGELGKIARDTAVKVLTDLTARHLT